MHTPLIVIADPDSGRSRETASALDGAYTCVQLNDGAEALEAIRARQPAAVVVDFPFPVAEGRCLAAALHDDPETAGIPVVAYSAWNYRNTRAKAREFGCTAFVAREDGPAAVARAVERLLERHPAVA